MRLPAFIRPPLKRVFNRVENARLAPLRKSLQEILRQHADARQVVIFAPSLAWYTQLFQRPQQLALALARQGTLVFYIEPKPDKKAPPFQEMHERMYWCNLPVRIFDGLERPLVYTLTWNYGYLSVFDEPRAIYDFVDDIDVFYGDHDQMRRDHEKLIQSAALMLVTADDLYQQVRKVRPDVVLSPNGVDYEHFARLLQPTQTQAPADLAPVLALGKPVIGYYGALARWFDFELLKVLANCRNDLAFVLIGPDYDSTLHPSGILDLPNVHWLGVKSYAELPEYLRYFDAAMIPFQVSKITHATSPLKLFEYMAGGKPVVITPMRESMRYGGVLVADGPEEFSQKLDQALQLRKDPDYLRKIEQVAIENTWDARARQILDELERTAC
jgi:glycosyltransferase involved in cell wall biosynthesis